MFLRHELGFYTQRDLVAGSEVLRGCVARDWAWEAPGVQTVTAGGGSGGRDVAHRAAPEAQVSRHMVTFRKPKQ